MSNIFYQVDSDTLEQLLHNYYAWLGHYLTVRPGGQIFFSQLPQSLKGPLKRIEDSMFALERTYEYTAVKQHMILQYGHSNDTNSRVQLIHPFVFHKKVSDAPYTIVFPQNEHVILRRNGVLRPIRRRNGRFGISVPSFLFTSRSLVNGRLRPNDGPGFTDIQAYGEHSTFSSEILLPKQWQSLILPWSSRGITSSSVFPDLGQLKYQKLFHREDIIEDYIPVPEEDKYYLGRKDAQDYNTPDEIVQKYGLSPLDLKIFESIVVPTDQAPTGITRKHLARKEFFTLVSILKRTFTYEGLYEESFQRTGLEFEFGGKEWMNFEYPKRIFGDEEQRAKFIQKQFFHFRNRGKRKRFLDMVRKELNDRFFLKMNMFFPIIVEHLRRLELTSPVEPIDPSQLRFVQHSENDDLYWTLSDTRFSYEIVELQQTLKLFFKDKLPVSDELTYAYHNIIAEIEGLEQELLTHPTELRYLPFIIQMKNRQKLVQRALSFLPPDISGREISASLKFHQVVDQPEIFAEIVPLYIPRILPRENDQDDDQDDDEDDDSPPTAPALGLLIEPDEDTEALLDMLQTSLTLLGVNPEEVGTSTIQLDEDDALIASIMQEYGQVQLDDLSPEEMDELITSMLQEYDDESFLEELEKRYETWLSDMETAAQDALALARLFDLEDEYRDKLDIELTNALMNNLRDEDSLTEKAKEWKRLDDERKKRKEAEEERAINMEMFLLNYDLNGNFHISDDELEEFSKSYIGDIDEEIVDLNTRLEALGDVELEDLNTRLEALGDFIQTMESDDVVSDSGEEEMKISTHRPRQAELA